MCIVTSYTKVRKLYKNTSHKSIFERQNHRLLPATAEAAAAAALNELRS